MLTFALPYFYFLSKNLKFYRMESERYLVELNEAHHRLKQREADMQVLDLAKNQLIEENQALNIQLETIIQENVTKLEV